jgi:hypothetical protein
MKRLITILLSLTLALTGCTEFDIVEATTSSEQSPTTHRSQTRTPASYQVNQNNPYSLQRVQQALDSLEGANTFQLVATHNYVRFLPQDSTDVYILIDSLDLDLFSYPFDYDLTLEEMEEHENTLINGYSYQYCLVPPSFQMPSEMESELLDYAYLLSEESLATTDHYVRIYHIFA